MRKRLFVRGSGKLTGTVRYGELELERGGQIAGNISVLSDGGGSIGAARASDHGYGQSRSALFGDSDHGSGSDDELAARSGRRRRSPQSVHPTD